MIYFKHYVICVILSFVMITIDTLSILAIHKLITNALILALMILIINSFLYCIVGIIREFKFSIIFIFPVLIRIILLSIVLIVYGFNIIFVLFLMISMAGFIILVTEIISVINKCIRCY